MHILFRKELVRLAYQEISVLFLYLKSITMSHLTGSKTSKWASHVNANPLQIAAYRLCAACITLEE
jgi:hypothetical protein